MNVSNLTSMDGSIIAPPSNAMFSGSPLGKDGPPPTPMPMVHHSNLDNLNMSMMENMGYDGSADLLHQQHQLHHEDNAGMSSVLPQTPWGGHEDYDFPASVGATEEQATDETYEQYEERVLNKRAAQMFHIIKSKLEVDSTIPFNTMCTVRNTRKQVAQKFYTMLVLKKAQAVELIQNSSYDTLLVTKGPKFLTASL